MFEVKKELLDSHEALLDVTIEEPTVKKAMQSAARTIAGQINIPGFRKGKAPYSVVLRYVGESAILEEAADHLLEELYPKFIESAEITPYSSGNLENIELDPMTFKIRVPLQPTVTLGNYTEIRKSWEEPSVNEEEINMVLEQMREENAIVEPVDRPAELGDEVEINIIGVANGEVVVDENDIHVILSENRPFLSAAFTEALIGISKGEERTFTIPLPEDMENEELSGVNTEFTAKATQVARRTLPGLDDAFASTVGAFETLEALRQDIYDRLLESKQQQTREAYRNELVKMLVDPAEVQFPPIMVSEMLDEMVEETEARVQRERQMSLEDALRLEGRTIEQFRDDMSLQAANRVKTSLVLAEFARAEETTATDDDVTQEYNSFFSRFSTGTQIDIPNLSLDSDLARSIRSTLLGRKALERLERIARGLGDETAFEDEEPVEETVESEDTDTLLNEDAVEESDAPVDSTVEEAETQAIPETDLIEEDEATETKTEETD